MSICHKYWLSGHLPIVADIANVIKAQFAQIVLNICDCYGAQKFAIENSLNDDSLLDKFDAQSWCLACQHTVFALPSSSSFWTRVLVYNNSWKILDGVCICKYLPAGILRGYVDCSVLNQHIGGRSGHCRKCDFDN